MRALKECQQAGLFVVGLDADGAGSLDDLDVAADPLVVVVGSEGRGLSRLVGETCDLTVSIPMAGPAESLNASVAGAVDPRGDRAPPPRGPGGLTPGQAAASASRSSASLNRAL